MMLGTRTLIAIGACVVAALPGLRQEAAAQQVTVGDGELEAYSEEVEEALVEIDMIPVPAGSISVEGAGGVETFDVVPFWMSSMEIPWDLFDVYAFGSEDGGNGEDAILRPSRPYGAPDRGYGHRGYAAISMTYLVAQEFAEWLSLRTGKSYRLPTAMEWEYACRAGREAPFAEDELEEHAWYWDNAFDETHPIGELAPNAFGLHDMVGNAAEWCVGMDGEPLACGGSFMDGADEVGCSARKTPSSKWQETDPQIPKSRFWLTDGPFMGFRVIRTP
jgi:formylglycine-generating enzyme required for sulfatase activity